MFRAAAGTGVVTRPLLVFYGLSQVGRAIAAAAASAGSGGWELEGHGIRCVPGTLRGPLPGIGVQADKEGSKGSFARLSELLGSPRVGEGGTAHAEHAVGQPAREPARAAG